MASSHIACKLHIDILLWAASWSRSVQFLQQLYCFKALKLFYYLIPFCDDYSHKNSICQQFRVVPTSHEIALYRITQLSPKLDNKNCRRLRYLIN